MVVGYPYDPNPLEYPYCGQNLAPWPIPFSGTEQEDLLMGFPKGPVACNIYNTVL
ncbi:MAG: hypothetical protein CM1200mP10_14110 [Candidatus Neomarinimicrobiota bacterium]|nr:MAG: hypothetical protein CM1200mP10_14110 [Candidatus Neomarinimicrobiota bacterium]